MCADINMSHIISEFSFGRYFPDITQPLDYSFEKTDQAFVAFQYFLTVVPTTYVAPRSKPLHTYQYSVTHYVKQIEHRRGTPGIFFKYDIDPVALEIHQRTTSLTQFLVRIVGVVGGVWVCFGWGLKVAAKVSQKAGLTGEDDEPITVEVTGMNTKKRWGGSSLNIRRRAGADDHLNGNGSPWSTPMATPSPYGGFSSQGTSPNPYGSFSAQGRPASPYAPISATGHPPNPYPPPPPSRSGSSFGLPPSPGPTATHLAPAPSSHFPASPLPNQSAFPSGSLAPPGSASGYSPNPLPPTPGSATSGGFAAAQQQQQQRSRPSSLVESLPPKRSSSLRNEKKGD